LYEKNLPAFCVLFLGIFKNDREVKIQATPDLSRIVLT